MQRQLRCTDATSNVVCSFPGYSHMILHVPLQHPPPVGWRRAQSAVARIVKTPCSSLALTITTGEHRHQPKQKISHFHQSYNQILKLDIEECLSPHRTSAFSPGSCHSAPLNRRRWRHNQLPVELVTGKSRINTPTISPTWVLFAKRRSTGVVKAASSTSVMLVPSILRLR